MKVIRTMNYEGSKIYVLQHWRLFQYFFYYKSQLYMQHVFAPPPSYRWLLVLFGKPLFDEGSLAQVEKTMLAGAMRSLDALKEGKSIIRDGASYAPSNIIKEANNVAVETTLDCEEE